MRSTQLPHAKNNADVLSTNNHFIIIFSITIQFLLLTMVVSLRDLFPDKDTVKIYPDDFYSETETDGGEPHLEENILFPDLLDRKRGHFSNERLVVFFRPGTYQVNFPVGYWTQVLGLGERPEDVLFDGNLGVYCLPAHTDNPGVGSLDTFWRGAENFASHSNFIPLDNGGYGVPIVKDGMSIEKSLTPDANGSFPNLFPVEDLSNAFPKEASDYEAQTGMLWAVSQAAPLRRISLPGKSNLHLSLGDNYASGGFLANLDLSGGYLLFGSQQQFCLRNTHVAQGASGGAWSMVFSGCDTDSDESCPSASTKKLHSTTTDSPSPDFPWIGKAPAVVNEPSTKVRVEKPYLFLSSDDGDEDKLYLGIPSVQMNSTGSNMTALDKHERVEVDNLKQVRVFGPKDSYDDVQASADLGTHIVLSPGIYDWGRTLEITNANQVVLGLGMATIQAPGDGSPCIHVSSQAYGVRLAGISLEANVISKFVYEGSTLLTWGEKDQDGPGGTPTNPGSLHDVYCFVGGRRIERTVKVQTMIKIYSSHVVGDNLWLWRADHVQLMPNERPNRPELSEYHVTEYGECQCDTGLEVFGDSVTFYGLAIEHTYKDMLKLARGRWFGVFLSERDAI